MTWLLARIDQEPTKTLDAWMVLEVPFDGAQHPWTRHLVGFRREGCKGQVSSPVELFDPTSRRAMTRSGQVYELGPLPGVNADAFALWSNWKHRNGIAHERDVTTEVDELLAAAHAHQTELMLKDALARRGDRPYSIADAPAAETLPTPRRMGTNHINSQPTDPVLEAALEWHRIGQEGEELLGARGWTLFRSYGRMMSGPYSGSYLSGLPVEDVRGLLTALKRGQRIPVHLMHRHRSGNYEASDLSLTDGRLVMHYPDRSEPAE